MSPNRARLAPSRHLTLIIAAYAVGIMISVRNDDEDDTIALEKETSNKTKLDIFNDWNIPKLSEIKKKKDTETLRSRLARPDKDHVTKVKFGIAFIKFSFLDMQKKVFSAVIVWTISWRDERNFRLLNGSKELTIPLDPQNELIWRPLIFIENTYDGKKGFETLKLRNSNITSFTKSIAGLFKIPSRISDYPFDTQTLEIVLSSTMYSADQLVLEPFTNETSTSFSSIDSDAFKEASYDVVSLRVHTRTEKTASWRQSKGRFAVTIKRHMKSWYRGHLTSMLLLVIMGYSIWFLPVLGPFAMPRVSASTLAYFTMSQTREAYLITLDGIPGGSWGEYYIQNFVWLQMLSIMLNVYVEYVAWALKLGRIARRLNLEIRFLYPILAAASYIITGRRATRWCGPHLLISVVFCYAVFSTFRVVQAYTGVVWCCPPLEKTQAERANSTLATKPDSATTAAASGS